MGRRDHIGSYDVCTHRLTYIPNIGMDRLIFTVLTTLAIHWRRSPDGSGLKIASVYCIQFIVLHFAVTSTKDATLVPLCVCLYVCLSAG